MTNSMGPTDSYYVVPLSPPSSNASDTRTSSLKHNYLPAEQNPKVHSNKPSVPIPHKQQSPGNRQQKHQSFVNSDNVDLSLENAALRAQLSETSLALEAYYDTFERQQAVLKASLAQLRADMQAVDRKKARETQQMIDGLMEENEKLKASNTKLGNKLEVLMMERKHHQQQQGWKKEASLCSCIFPWQIFGLLSGPYWRFFSNHFVHWALISKSSYFVFC